jgi:DNA-binding NtrC family response regulator
LKRVFILDDDEDIIEVLSHILGKQYTLCCKTNADDIYQSIVNFKPDIILMDNFIGQRNASDIIHHLRNSEQPLSTPVILFSAAHNIEEVASSIGAASYLAKPASIGVIRETIKNMLG